jgi:hypothetical protein
MASAASPVVFTGATHGAMYCSAVRLLVDTQLNVDGHDCNRLRRVALSTDKRNNGRGGCRKVCEAQLRQARAATSARARTR